VRIGELVAAHMSCRKQRIRVVVGGSSADMCRSGTYLPPFSNLNFRLNSGCESQPGLI
jgi:hypothetical protein